MALPMIISLVDAFSPAIRLSLDLADDAAREFLRGYNSSYAQILGELNDDDALAFKTSVYNECTMIAVAAAIVAQIAITGLSLDSLSQTHWVARACFVLSMTFALMAVYYATTQQRTLGRLLKARDVRLWIRGGNYQSQPGRIVPSFEDMFRKFYGRTLSDRPRQVSAPVFPRVWDDYPRFMSSGFSIIATIIQVSSPHFGFVSSEPDDYAPDLSNTQDIKSNIIYHCFTPSAASVITISAPQMMLTSSLVMLLIALGIYFGFIWTRNLDQLAGPNDSRKVFITYVVGLSIAGLVYRVSQLFQDDEKRSERRIVEDYLEQYLANPAHQEAVARWGLEAQPVVIGTPLAEIAREGVEDGGETRQPRGPPAEA